MIRTRNYLFAFLLSNLLITIIYSQSYGAPPFPLVPVLTRTSTGYLISNLTQLGSFSIQFPASLNVTENFITPNYTGLTINGNIYQNVNATPLLLESFNNTQVYVQLMAINWTPPQPTSSISIYELVTTPSTTTSTTATTSSTTTTSISSITASQTSITDTTTTKQATTQATTSQTITTNTISQKPLSQSIQPNLFILIAISIVIMAIIGAVYFFWLRKPIMINN